MLIDSNIALLEVILREIKFDVSFLGQGRLPRARTCARKLDFRFLGAQNYSRTPKFSFFKVSVESSTTPGSDVLLCFWSPELQFRCSLNHFSSIGILNLFFLISWLGETIFRDTFIFYWFIDLGNQFFAEYAFHIFLGILFFFFFFFSFEKLACLQRAFMSF